MPSSSEYATVPTSSDSTSCTVEPSSSETTRSGPTSSTVSSSEYPQEYLSYVDEIAQKGETPVSYDEWFAIKSAYGQYKTSHPDYPEDMWTWWDNIGKEPEPIRHTVTFDTRGGNPVEPISVAHGEKIPKPADPTRNGYEFVRWEDKDAAPWAFQDRVITKDIELFAVWSDPIDYAISFVNDGGTVLYETTAHYGDALQYPFAAPSPENPEPRYVYTFDGWDKELTVVGDMVFSAQYRREYIPTTAYYRNYDGTLLATVPLTEVQDPLTSYDGETPTHPNDDDLQYQFREWIIEGEETGLINLVAHFDACTDGLEFADGVLKHYSGTAKDVTVPSRWNGQLITKVGEGAFDGCTALESVVIPGTVASIGEKAFEFCLSLKSAVMHEGVTSIGDQAFYHCGALESVTIPSTMTSIGTRTFASCSSLKSVVIPQRVSSIGLGAFLGVAAVLVPSRTAKAKDWNNNWAASTTVVWKYDGNGLVDDGTYRYYVGADVACIVSVSDEVLDIEIPATLSGKKAVLSENALVQSQAFQNKTLHSISFAKGASYGGNWPQSFQGFTQLVSVTIPEGVTSIEEQAFAGCMALESIAFSSTVGLIGKRAFYYCTSLESVEMPTGLWFIENYAFAGCTALKSIKMPGVSKIGSWAFKDCTSLESVEMSERIKWLESYAFEDCTALKSVIIPYNNPLSVCSGLFTGCTALESVFFGGTQAQWNSSLGYPSPDIRPEATLYFYSENQPAESGNYWRYVDGIPTVW